MLRSPASGVIGRDEAVLVGEERGRGDCCWKTLIRAMEIVG